MVSDLDFENTYKKLRGSEIVKGGLNIIKGTVPFWLNLNNEKVRVRISNKGDIHIWHREKPYIYKAEEKLKSLTVNSEGESCNNWVLMNMQRIGSTRITRPLSIEESVVKIEEADCKEVEENTEAILKALREGNKDILSSRIDQLKQLSERNRVAHCFQVLKSIEECLGNPMLVDNSETFRKLVDTLSNILSFEQYHKPSDWDKIVETIQGKISPKVISLVKENPKFPDHSTVRFLGKCGMKEAVETIFEKIKSNPSEAHIRLDIDRALAEQYSKNRKLINKQLYALMQEKNPALVEHAKKLRQEIMRMRSIYFRG